MNIVVIPKTLTKGQELVVIPKRVYDKLEQAYQCFHGRLGGGGCKTRAQTTVKIGEFKKYNTRSAFRRTLAGRSRQTLCCLPDY